MQNNTDNLEELLIYLTSISIAKRILEGHVDKTILDEIIIMEATRLNCNEKIFKYYIMHASNIYTQCYLKHKEMPFFLYYLIKSTMSYSRDRILNLITFIKQNKNDLKLIIRLNSMRDGKHESNYN